MVAGPWLSVLHNISLLSLSDQRTAFGLPPDWVHASDTGLFEGKTAPLRVRDRGLPRQSRDSGGRLLVPASFGSAQGCQRGSCTPTESGGSFQHAPEPGGEPALMVCASGSCSNQRHLPAPDGSMQRCTGLSLCWWLTGCAGGSARSVHRYAKQNSTTCLQLCTDRCRGRPTGFRRAAGLPGGRR
jgi:hypothetical protein